MGKESKMDKDMNDLKDKEAGEKDRDPGGLNKKPKLKALNPMIFLVVIILLCAIASYVVPAGSFARVTNAATGGGCGSGQFSIYGQDSCQRIRCADVGDTGNAECRLYYFLPADYRRHFCNYGRNRCN